MINAIVFVNCSEVDITPIEKAVKAVEGVFETNKIIGVYDLVLKVQAIGNSKLEEVIKQVQQVLGVSATMTTIIRNGKA